MKKASKKIISTLLLGGFAINVLCMDDAFASTQSITPVESWYCTEKTTTSQLNTASTTYKKLEHLQVKYSNSNIIITGTAEGTKKVVAKYDNEEKTANVTSGKFQLNLKYTKEKNIKLYGLNKQGKKITQNTTIKSNRFVTAKPVCTKITRTKKGITCEVNTEAGSSLTIKNNGKILSQESVDSSFTKIFIREKDLKGKKGKLVFSQKKSNKRASKNTYPLINIGECFQSQQ